MVSLIKDMNVEKFVELEQERFLNEFYSPEKVRQIIPEVTDKQYPSVRQSTQDGMNKGIEDWLRETGAPSLYESNLREFCFDESVERRVIGELSDVLDHPDVPEFAKDVRQTYAAFLYNDSLDRFRKSI